MNSQEDVGGYPMREPTTRVLTVPADRRAWLERFSRELTDSSGAYPDRSP